MNLKDYISSGILEAYLLDEVTPQERMEVQRMLSQHPELQQELEAIEETMEAFAKKLALAPRKDVKAKILAIAEKTSLSKPQGKIVQLESPKIIWRF